MIASILGAQGIPRVFLPWRKRVSFCRMSTEVTEFCRSASWKTRIGIPWCTSDPCSRPVVNLSNILQAAFSTFMPLQFGFVIFWQRKMAQKLLVKWWLNWHLLAATLVPGPARTEPCHGTGWSAACRHLDKSLFTILKQNKKFKKLFFTEDEIWRHRRQSKRWSCNKLISALSQHHFRFQRRFRFHIFFLRFQQKPTTFATLKSVKTFPLGFPRETVRQGGDPSMESGVVEVDKRLM